jgi:hypothetical protein
LYPFGTLLPGIIYQEKSGNPGVDVMITIFCDFWQFSAKKIGVFLKNQCYDQIFAKTSCSLSKKTPIFSLNVSAKIFKKS